MGRGSLGNALLTTWHRSLLYTFPPAVLVARTLEKIMFEEATVILIALAWPRQPWYPLLHRISICPPWTLPLHPDLLSQEEGALLHPKLDSLHLTAWLITGSYMTSTFVHNESRQF